MKRLIMLAMILAVLTISLPPVFAAGPQTTTASAQTSAVQTSATQSSTTQTVTKPRRIGFFAKLWELEKRKNAAIRRMLGWE